MGEGLGCFRKLVALKILWETLAQISSIQEVSNLFSPRMGFC